VPIQLTLCWFPGLAIFTATIIKYIFFKYTEAILSNSSTALGNCYGLKLPKCWLEFKKNKIIVLYIAQFSAHFRSLMKFHYLWMIYKSLLTNLLIADLLGSLIFCKCRQLDCSEVDFGFCPARARYVAPMKKSSRSRSQLLRKLHSPKCRKQRFFAIL